MALTARRKLAFDTVEAVAELNSVQDIEDHLGCAISKWGFATFGVGAMPPLVKSAHPIIAAEKAPPGWRDFYKCESLYRINHIAAHVRASSMPFRYSEAPYDPDHSADNERFMAIIRDYRIGKGIVVPVGRHRNVPACAWMAGENPELDDEVMTLVQLIALFTSSRIYALANPDDKSQKPLTTRERDVLTWAAYGKSAWEIGEILGIAKRTVDEHTQSAARKLGASNKTQAVAIALVHRFIEL